MENSGTSIVVEEDEGCKMLSDESIAEVRTLH